MVRGSDPVFSFSGAETSGNSKIRLDMGGRDAPEFPR